MSIEAGSSDPGSAAGSPDRRRSSGLSALLATKSLAQRWIKRTFGFIPGEDRYKLVHDFPSLESPPREPLLNEEELEQAKKGGGRERASSLPIIKKRALRVRQRRPPRIVQPTLERIPSISLSSGKLPRTSSAAKPAFTKQLAAEVKAEEAKVEPDGGGGPAFAPPPRAEADAAPMLEDYATEAWPEYLERATGMLKGAQIAEDPKALWNAFRTSTDLSVVYATFAKLFHLATTSEELGGLCKVKSHCGPPNFPWAESVPGRPRDPDGMVKWTFPYEVIRLLPGLPFQAKNLWQLLDQRQNLPAYESQPCGDDSRLADKRALIAGGGPCGFRAAIEYRLLGMQATLVERRKRFTRINQLHLWDWVAREMNALGCKVLDPPPNDFAADPAIIHSGIGDLQVFLLKIALLLGVEVLFGVDYDRITWNGQSWRAHLCPGRHQATVEGRAGSEDGAGGYIGPAADATLPSPMSGTVLDDVGVLVGATGFAGCIGAPFGLSADEEKSSTAIGLIVNVKRENGANERKLKHFAISRQYYVQHFKKAYEQTGLQLENILFTKASSSHYFVMTPTMKSLVETGVVKNGSVEKALQVPGNIDVQRLNELTWMLLAYKWKADQESCFDAIKKDCAAGAEPAWCDGGPRLFDFSYRKRQETGITFVKPPGRAASTNDDLMITLVGDNLMEPFWPEGLGIIRGWFSVLDAAAATQEWAEKNKGNANAAQLSAHSFFADAYSQLKSINIGVKNKILKADEKSEKLWGIDPASRYRAFVSR